jgi:VIT1/CCC1 family predicted Fe2+/Mn2+ transporter
MAARQQEVSHQSGRVLDPVERVSEVLFGLIMVLTFTGSLSAATAGHAEIKEMLYGAVGCNLAWGIVDAVMYVMSSLLNRGRGLIVLRAVREARDPGQARDIISNSLNPYVASLLRPSVFETVREDLVKAPEPPAGPSLTRDDIRGAVGVFLLVFLSTFPVVIPFLLIGDPVRALRTSNAVAVAMLCVGGYALGRHAGLRPWLVAVAMAALGALLVAITIALGG